MFTNDFSKMFDPQQAAKTWQSMFNLQGAMQTSQQNMETFKQVSSLWANTMSTCSDLQMQYCQSSMEDCITAMRELSTAKGLEDYMQKQAKLSQQAAEKAQSTAQDIAQQWQKTQTQCTDLISKQMMQSMEWANQQTQQATSKATGSSK